MNFLNKNDKTSSLQTSSLQSSSILLDPFTVIIKLALLSHKPIGSKICVVNNIFYIQDQGIFQSVVRIYFKFNKNDLQFIYNPIELACKKFLHDDILKSFPNIKILFEYAIKGLNNLSKTYDNQPMVKLSINYYINIIQNYINEYNIEGLFIQDNNTPLYTDNIVSQLHNRWSTDRINLVLTINDYLCKNDNKNNNIKCLEQLLNDIDKETQNIILPSL